MFRLAPLRPGLWLSFLVAVTLLLVGPATSAQVDTGAIVGVVSDSSGSRVPDATITVKEEATGIVHVVRSDSNGNYTLNPLKLGLYTLTVTHEGFKTLLREHIEVTIQSRLEVNPTLEVGAIAESVEVTSTSPILETQSPSIQQLVDTRTINDLPLNGRNASFLAQLSPGVTFAQSDSRGLGGSGSFTANGARRTQNNYLLDGMDNNSNIADLVNQGQYVVMPPPDALREFTVQTSNYSAEFGHSAGAVLNVSTKSGTNTFHGDLWEFLRNDLFDARDYFANPALRKPKFRQNQFGGALGGPLSIPHVYSGHNRTFFFVDYQGTRIVQGSTYVKTVPTLAERNSNFTNLNDLVTLQGGTRTDALGRTLRTGTVLDPTTTRAVTRGAVDPVTGLLGTTTGFARDPFYAGTLRGTTDFTSLAALPQLNQIPAGRLDPVAVNILKLYDSPTSAALLNNFTVSPTNTNFTDSGDARLDQQFSSRDSAFVRYSYVDTRQNYAPPFSGIADGSNSRPGTGETISQNAALSWTHILTQHLVNETRVGYSRVYDRRDQAFANQLGIPDSVGIPGVPQIAGNGGLPLMTFGSLANLGAPTTIPSDKASDVTQATENLSVDRGAHQIRGGFEFQHIVFPFLTPTQSRGSFAFSGIYTSVVNATDGSTDRAQFLLAPQVSPYARQFDYLGGANSVAASNFPPAFHPLRNYFGGYVQDAWRAAPTFTLTYGVRYEFLGVPAERDGRFGNFIPGQTGDTPDGLSHYYVPQNHLSELPQGFLNLLTANAVTLTPLGTNAIGQAQHTNVAPRLGFALQPSSRLSLRGGYGLFYQGNENHGLSVSPYIDYPFQVTSTYNGASAVQAIIADSVNHTSPEGTVGPISRGLANVPLTPGTVSLSSLSFQGEPINPKTTYSQAYDLQLQYQLSSSMIAFVGYVGSNARHMQTSIPTNTTSTIAPPATSLPSIAFFRTLATGGNYLGHIGSSNYNSLQFGAERRFRSGLAFLANMTYSKCMSDARDLLDNPIGGYRAPYVPGGGIGIDNTLCDVDTRLNVHASGTYELPFGSRRKYLQSGPAAWIVGGWSANWIFTAQKGVPISIPCPTTTASGLGCFAVKVPGVDPYAGPHNIRQYLNPAAFANPPAVAAGATGTLTNLGGPGGQVIGPPFRRFDFSIFRRFPFVRESYFEFRAEAFNLTNTPNFAQPGTLNFNNVQTGPDGATVSTGTFASITSTRNSPNDERQIQLSLKLYF